jgi:hypothetical protein
MSGQRMNMANRRMQTRDCSELSRYVSSIVSEFPELIRLYAHACYDDVLDARYVLDLIYSTAHTNAACSMLALWFLPYASKSPCNVRL